MVSLPDQTCHKQMMDADRLLLGVVLKRRWRILVDFLMLLHCHTATPCRIMLYHLCPQKNTCHLVFDTFPQMMILPRVPMSISCDRVVHDTSKTLQQSLPRYVHVDHSLSSLLSCIAWHNVKGILHLDVSQLGCHFWHCKRRYWQIGRWH